MTSDKSNLFVAIDVESIKDRLKEVASPPLEQPSRTFLKNMRDIDCLVLMPKEVLEWGNMYGVAELVDGFMMMLWKAMKQTGTPPWRGKLGMTEDGSPAGMVPESVRKSVVEQWKELITREPRLQASRQPLMSAAVSGLWTALECVAGDSWVQCLNANPKLFGTVVKHLPDGSTEDGLERKSISIGLLGKYGFDLRGRIGDLLKPKFDFTSTAGMRNAYRGAFGECALDLFNNPWIDFLQATRNLIVHKAGLVDEDFRRATNFAGEDGSLFEIEPAMVSKFGKAVGDIGCNILLFLQAKLA